MTTVVFDWDGVIGYSPDYDWSPAAVAGLEFEPIREAFRRGYTVAVSTCNDVGIVSRALTRAGFAVYGDYERRIGPGGWHPRASEGQTPQTILVTNMKVSGVIVDDRAVNYCHGEAVNELFDKIEDSESFRHYRRNHARV